MSKKELWQRYCQYQRFYPQVGLGIDVSRMRFPEGLFAELLPRFKEAFRDMDSLERGGVANPDEERMVGHYWLRNPQLAPSPDISSAIPKNVEEIKHFASDVHAGRVTGAGGARFTRVLLVGIGGSALGPQLLADALTEATLPVQMMFLDNTDPDGIGRVLKQIEGELPSTLVVVTSKSGGTVETRNGMLEVMAAFARQGVPFGGNAVAITMPGSALDKKASAEQWLRRFEMWDWVGGRTSMFSAVGLLPAALVGIDIDSMLQGAAAMDALTRVHDVAENPAALLAAMWHYAGGGAGRRDMVILPYKDRLVLLSRYLQQLVMESLGKEKDLSDRVVNQGIAVYGNKGSTDQHAYVQQLREGLNNFFVTFIEVRKDVVASLGDVPAIEVEKGVTSGDYLEGFLLGTRQALYDNGRESMTITLDSLTPHSFGALVALFERTVGLYAFLVDINAYHQPGVEAGKKAASRVIDLQGRVLRELEKWRGELKTADEIAAALEDPSEAETIFHVLMRLSANGGRGVRAEGDRAAPNAMRFGC